jgi:AcrR family transcriptional regulator
VEAQVAAERSAQVPEQTEHEDLHEFLGTQRDGPVASRRVRNEITPREQNGAQPISDKSKRNPQGRASFDPEVTSAIMEAVLSDLADKGLAGMSVDGVARRAGVGKSAIYRRWSSKEQMTAAILREIGMSFHPDPPETGSLRGDLHQVMNDFLAWLTDDPRVGQIFLAVLAEGRRNPEFAAILDIEIDQPRRTRVSTIFTQAVERGEVDADYDSELAMDVLGGTVFWHQLARRLEVDEAYIDRLIDVLELTWQPAGAAVKRGRRPASKRS